MVTVIDENTVNVKNEQILHYALTFLKTHHYKTVVVFHKYVPLGSDTPREIIIS